MRCRVPENPERESVRSRLLLVVRRSPLGRARAILQFGGLTFPAAIGRGGVTAMKREGDGATPRAQMRLIAGYYRGDRIGRPASPSEARSDRRAHGMVRCAAPRQLQPARPPALRCQPRTASGAAITSTTSASSWTGTGGAGEGTPAAPSSCTWRARATGRRKAASPSAGARSPASPRMWCRGTTVIVE